MEEISKDDIEDNDQKQNADINGTTDEQQQHDDNTKSMERPTFTPSPPSGPYTPLFVYLKVGESSQSNSTVTKYNILSQKITETCKREVVRQYEDFEWLHHSLISHCNLLGVIVPPLPSRPVIIDNKTAEHNNDQLADKTMTPDPAQYDRNAAHLERYLKLLIVHSSFGSTPLLNQFLTEVQPATRSKVRKGFTDLISWKIDYKIDLESDFQLEYETQTSLLGSLLECSEDFSRMVAANHRLSVAHAHLASTVTQTIPFYTVEWPQLVKNFKQWSEAYEDARRGAEIDAFNEDRSLGGLLEHYVKYLGSAKDMLNRRLKLISEYDDAKRAADRAKPQKKESAEEARSIAEAAAVLCTDTARKEIKQFHRDRVLAMQDGLVRYADSKITTAQDAYNLLLKSLKAIQQTS